jgi:uncharacterized protein YecE (DUF72 family)
MERSKISINDELKRFRFRGLHPHIFVGTASDRYAGWIGQIYTAEKYQGRITLRSHTVGGKVYREEILPVDSVREYFKHFSILELDYTFYRPLLTPEGEPTSNYYVLRNYTHYLEEDDRIVLKVPQEVCAIKIRQGNQTVVNPHYLNSRVFLDQFYHPANKLLGSNLAGMLFEQEYQRLEDRIPIPHLASGWDAFFESLPRDTRYHLELRTEAYWSPPVLEVLEKHGVGQVLSHWTWLPSLSRQLARAGGHWVTAGRTGLVRLMTPLDMRYEEAFALAHPFDKLVEGMLSPGLVHDTVELMKRAAERERDLFLIINNRAGGNAPLIAQEIARKFLS